MVKKNTDYFKIVDNFAKTAHIPSIAVFESTLDFIPKVTIAIPTYKRPKLLKEALDSAINQMDYFDYDIIVVDNNPQRGCETEKLMLSYKSPRLSYYKNAENIQVTGNLNRLYTLAKGEYVVMLHDDDLLYPDYLSILFQIVNKYKGRYNAFSPPYIEHNARGANKIPERTQSISFYAQELKMANFLWAYVGGPVSGMCSKKHSVLKIGGYNQDFYPSIDYDFIVRFVHQYKICRLFGYPLSIYRIQENNMSSKAEVLLGFVASDTAIKKGILATYEYKLLKYLWVRYINVFVFKFLEYMTKTWDNKEIEINEELYSMGYHYSWADLFIYKIMNKYRRIASKQKRFEKIAGIK
ncbi:MAG: glycosyltransferase family 2 protein [Bacteroidales bacterium]|nr:glycosyltransferase family 2 protein [Bacteroidales bacterium]